MTLVTDEPGSATRGIGELLLFDSSLFSLQLNGGLQMSETALADFLVHYVSDEVASGNM